MTTETLSNYIPTRNPFSLPVPPSWWLRKMADMDAALVIFPSVLRRAYILARRRSMSLRMPASLKLNNDLVKMSAHGDGDVLAAHNVAYVDSLTGWGSVWTEQPLRDLKSRDMWAAGGAEAYNAQLLATEAKVEKKKRTTLLDDLDHRARDGYRSYKARTGQRNQRGWGSSRPATIVPVGTL